MPGQKRYKVGGQPELNSSWKKEMSVGKSMLGGGGILQSKIGEAITGPNLCMVELVGGMYL